jgi:hypothetical protein
MGDLWAALVCDEMLRQAEAGGSRGVSGSATGSAQEAAAACVAYGTMSEFASDFGSLLAGLADDASEQRADVLAFLQANRMYACQRLLARTDSAAAGEQHGSVIDSSAGAAAAQAHAGGAGGARAGPVCWVLRAAAVSIQAEAAAASAAVQA